MIPGGRFECSRGVVLKAPGGPGGAEMEPSAPQMEPGGDQMEPGGSQMEPGGAQMEMKWSPILNLLEGGALFSKFWSPAEFKWS